MKLMNSICQNIYLNSFETSLSQENHQRIQNYLKELEKLDEEISILQKRNETIQAHKQILEFELQKTVSNIERNKKMLKSTI